MSSSRQATPSGGNPILSSKAKIRLTIPEFCAVVVVVAGGVLGWSRLDGRLSRIEERMDAFDHERTASRPILTDPVSAPKDLAYGSHSN